MHYNLNCLIIKQININLKNRISNEKHLKTKWSHLRNVSIIIKFDGNNEELSKCQ